MKIRNGFVSNSSSASFIVALSVLTGLDKDKILNYDKFESDRGWTDGWTIEVDDEKGIIRGYTSMDNGDFSDYIGPELMKKITIQSD